MKYSFSPMQRLFASTRFFYVWVGLFVLGAGWIAITSIYPMAFDEEFHLGLIKIYATSWMPYGIQHTSDMAQFGAATADPSYLFHYLMSFPYRLFHALGVQETVIIIIFRLMNLAFIVGGLAVFRKAFLKAGISASISHLALLLMTLIPTFVMLAAQINYDNLLFLVVAWSVYLLVSMTQSVRQKKQISLTSAWLLTISVLLGMSIKYAFLPIALGLFIWSVGLVVISVRNNQLNITCYAKKFFSQFWRLPTKVRIGLILASVLSLFFASHYITNHATYGSAIPSCEQVFNEDECAAYGPWNRNRMYVAERDPSFKPLAYPMYMATEWIPGMTERLTFAVAGKTNGFQTKAPLPAVVFSFVALTIVGVICMVVQIAKRRFDWFGILSLLLFGIYVAVLSAQLYGDYVETAQPVAINGRYLILLLPLVAVVLIQSIHRTFEHVSPGVKSLVAIIILLVILIGGAGASTYILQSEAHWYWAGFGQTSHALLKNLLGFVTLPFRV
jgi:Ca2+/Na+ antiporter